MQKRKLIIGTYDTAAEGLWTLSAWTLGRASAYENYIEIPGHSGPLDLSAALTDGEPYYGSREFEAILESSEGTRLERETRIDNMINKLDGWRLNITLPDDSLHYITGRIRVEKLYNDPAHASVRITATCDPWRYHVTETVVGLTAKTTEQTATLINNGRCSVVPTITITGGTVTLKLTRDGVTLKLTRDGVTQTWALSAGTYVIGDIYLKTGSLALSYSGTGQAVLKFREAVL